MSYRAPRVREDTGMSPFPVRMQATPEPSPVRRWVEPIAVGAALDGILIGIALLLGGANVVIPLLLFAVAAVLGWRYGFVRGAVAVCAPLAVLLVAELVRQAAGGTGGPEPISAILIVVAVLMFLAFTAFLASAIRGRYRRPRPKPGGEPESAYTSEQPWRS